MAEQIVDRSTGRRVELEKAALGVSHQYAAALERPADPLGQPLDERLQLGLARRRHAPKHRGLGADEIRAVEHEHVEMNVEVERGAEALNQRHGAGRATRASEPGLLENMSRDRAVRDAEQPAVANAVFAATMTRVTSLPLAKHGFV